MYIQGSFDPVIYIPKNSCALDRQRYRRGHTIPLEGACPPPGDETEQLDGLNMTGGGPGARKETAQAKALLRPATNLS